MGWGYGILESAEEVGYGVETVCGDETCSADIDKGMAFVCGGDHGGGEAGCGRYFCYSHLFMGGPTQLCSECIEQLPPESEPTDDLPF